MTTQKKTIVNATNKPVTLIVSGDKRVTLPPSGLEFRTMTETRDAGRIEHPGTEPFIIPLLDSWATTRLPQRTWGEARNSIYIVDQETAQTAMDQPDLVYPTRATYGADGRLLGYAALARAVPVPDIVSGTIERIPCGAWELPVYVPSNGLKAVVSWSGGDTGTLAIQSTDGSWITDEPRTMVETLRNLHRMVGCDGTEKDRLPPISRHALINEIKQAL